jgi:hypothetical protein
MSNGFQFDEKANSPDLTDEEIASAVATSSTEDLIPFLETPCGTCGKPWVRERHEKRFRFPHFYSRVKLVCPEGHEERKIFQMTWLYQAPA